MKVSTIFLSIFTNKIKDFVTDLKNLLAGHCQESFFWILNFPKKKHKLWFDLAPIAAGFFVPNFWIEARGGI